jgi:hypothetical protein
VASLRVRYEQLTRLDFHQLGCSLVGRSDILKILTFFVFLDSDKGETWEKWECEKVVKEKDCERIIFFQNKA